MRNHPVSVKAGFLTAFNEVDYDFRETQLCLSQSRISHGFQFCFSASYVVEIGLSQSRISHGFQLKMILEKDLQLPSQSKPDFSRLSINGKL